MCSDTLQMGVSTGDGAYAVQANVLTLWAAMFATFQVLGQVSAGFISDWFGRRVSLYLVIFWAYIGVMLEMISKDWRMWTGSKIVIGYGAVWYLVHLQGAGSLPDHSNRDDAVDRTHLCGRGRSPRVPGHWPQLFLSVQCVHTSPSCLIEPRVADTRLE